MSSLDKPLVGVNHIEGHIYSVCFENPPVEHPALALIVSGGHTNLFFVPEPGKYKVVGRTRDEWGDRITPHLPFFEHRCPDTRLADVTGCSLRQGG